MKKSELENRLVKFSVQVIGITKTLNESFEAQHLSKQIIRSGTACALLYGEVQGSPTKKDFIHKISLVLRELRETFINLKIIRDTELANDQIIMERLIDECNQLISIFTKTYQTAIANETKERMK